ncbi:MAG TPA: MarR family transcriptional regulator [Allosphingosinicella sp.]|jgi:DNA-binding MarR family transcriptional regulator
MDENDHLIDVLRSYPQIYLACHVEHRTRNASASGLTSREASFLTHIEADGTSPADLARHLGIAPSTLSAALARLEGLGLVRLERDAGDARRKRVQLTQAGRSAIADNSVLDAGRVAALLAAMPEKERRLGVEGLKLLAAAARRVSERGPR